MEEPEEKIVVLRAYDTVVEANLAKTKLDAYGIPCFLTDENFTGWYPVRNSVFPGVRLHIFEKDHDEAAMILDGDKNQPGFIACPQCGSHDHEPYLSGLERLNAFFAGVLGFLFVKAPHASYQCNHCQHIFAAEEMPDA
jgi:hypothetical protein